MLDHRSLLFGFIVITACTSAVPADDLLADSGLQPTEDASTGIDAHVAPDVDAPVDASQDTAQAEPDGEVDAPWSDDASNDDGGAPVDAWTFDGPTLPCVCLTPAESCCKNPLSKNFDKCVPTACTSCCL